MIGRGTDSSFVGLWQSRLDFWLVGHHRRQVLIDGLFGPRTETATAVFQRAVHLPADGIVGQKTWAAIAKAGNPGPP